MTSASTGPALFDRIVLVYNPVNRRVPRRIADMLQSELTYRLPKVPVTLQATQHAGHARELTRLASENGRPLIIAVSGDGVYNEIVNGLRDLPRTEALVAVAAGGNANDHRRSTKRMPLVDAIVAAHAQHKVRRLDLLQLTVRTGGSAGTGTNPWVHYAHSYIGFGLTPLMAAGLNRDRKGALAELSSVLRTFSSLTPVELVRAGGRVARYDSLIFANITGMAKYGRLSRTSRPDDGRFEVIACRHGRRWRIAAMALRAATIGLRPQAQVSSVNFTTTTADTIQIDGELVPFGPGADVRIDCLPRALPTIG